MKNIVQHPTYTEPKFRLAILRFLNARISFPSWMLALSSCALAWVALFLLATTDEGLMEFGDALPVDGWFWAGTLAVANTLVIVSFLYVKAERLMRYSSFVSAMMWVLGGIAFATSGQKLTAVVVALPWFAFYGYVYLASYFRERTGI
jgi:hypothetical protein